MRVVHVLITAGMAAVLGFIIAGCTPREPLRPDQLGQLDQAVLALPTGQTIRVFMAQTPSERHQGLSDVRPEDFGPAQGMLFIFPRLGLRVFSMRRTWLDLDIFFLTSDLRVLSVQRNLPRHPGRNTDHPPAKTRPIVCRHVLEMRADSTQAQKIEPGMRLQWRSPTSSIPCTTHKAR